MLKTFKAFEAPYRYDFVDPDTGHKFIDYNRDSLIDRIVAYRSQNRLAPIEKLPEVLNNYWCSQPENVGKCRPCEEEVTRGFYAVLQGGITLLKALAMKHFSPQEVADARSEQCKDCKYNSFPDRGPFRVWIDDVAVSCVGSRKSKHHEDIGICAVCTCPLRSKVFIEEKLPAFTPKQVELLRGVKCWQLKLSGQDDSN